MHYRIILVGVLLLGVLVIVGAQFSIPTLFGADGYLHIRMAQFIREYGLRYDFHWARYSTFAKNFADKDFLYHLLLIPFTFLPNIFLGAKISACVFAIFLYLIFFLLLRHYSARALVPVFLIIFLLSAPFLQVIAQPRNMVLIMGLTLVFTHFLIKKNQWALFIITVAYALSHVSGPYLLLFAFLGECGRFINEKRFTPLETIKRQEKDRVSLTGFTWKSIRSVVLGLLVGYLIHPNFPNNLLSFYLNGILVPIFALKWGLELGAEFFPVQTRDFVLGYPFIFVGLLLLIALGMSQTKKLKTSTVIWMSITSFFFVFSFFSQRYLSHSYPLVLISCAAYLSDWWESKDRLLLIREKRMVKLGLLVGILLVFSLLGFHTYQDFRQRALGERAYNQHFEAVGKWMAQNFPEGEIIFHSNWSDSQYFIGINPKDDYFVTFDPIYMYYWDPKKYNLYRDIAFGRSADPHSALKNEFGVRYGYAGKIYFSGLINQLRHDLRFTVLAEDGLGLIFRVN